MDKEKAIHVVRSLIEDGRLDTSRHIRFTYYMVTRHCWNIHLNSFGKIVFDYETLEDGRVFRNQLLSSKIERFVEAFCRACRGLKDRNLF